MSRPSNHRHISNHFAELIAELRTATSEAKSESRWDQDLVLTSMVESIDDLHRAYSRVTATNENLVVVD